VEFSSSNYVVYATPPGTSFTFVVAEGQYNAAHGPPGMSAELAALFAAVPWTLDGTSGDCD
jgi:hypothetical protein